MLDRAKHLLVTELATVRNTTEQTSETNIVALWPRQSSRCRRLRLSLTDLKFNFTF